RLAAAPRGGHAGHRGPVAPRRLAPVLAVALSLSGRTTTAHSRSAGADRAHVAGEPVVGQRAHSGRVAQAGDSGEQPLHPAVPLASPGAATEPELAHLSGQPRARHLGGGPAGGADAHLQDPVRAAVHHPRPARAGASGGDGAPQRRLGLAAGGRGNAVGSPAHAPHPRSGPRLRQRLPPAGGSARHRGRAHTGAGAPRQCGGRARDRHAAPRVPRPRHPARRAAPAHDPSGVRRVLQPRPAAPHPAPGDAPAAGTLTCGPSPTVPGDPCAPGTRRTAPRLRGRRGV
ncbi:MAG: hypothetical protein AVDCRST_MAG77-1447, partial [uncultured Chloroflexi bacterium]